MGRRIPSAYNPQNPYGSPDVQQYLQQQLMGDQSGRESNERDPGGAGNRGTDEPTYAPQQQAPAATPPPEAPPAAAPPPAAPPAPAAFDYANAPLPTRGGAGQLTGYPSDLGRSMKHVYGAIASRYGNDRANLDKILADPEFQQWFPNAKKVKDDTIDFGGQLSDFTDGVPVNLVDVYRGGDDAAQWIDQNYVNDGGLGASGLNPDLISALSGMGGSSILDQIQQELQAAISGKPSPTSQNYLQTKLGGGA